MAESKHTTPLPWTSHGWEHDQDAACVFSRGALIARVCYLGGTEPAEANARLIIKAVNYHERLVEFLDLVAGMKTAAEADAAAPPTDSEDLMRPIATTVLEWIARDEIVTKARALLAEIDQ